MTSRPSRGEYAEFFTGYVSQVPETDILSVLEGQLETLHRVMAGISPEQEVYRYLPDKWSIREVVGHLVDAERVFGHRAFCISRGENANLPSFDEVLYVGQSNYDERPLQELIGELADVRRSNLHFYRRLQDEDWRRQGTASNNPTTVRALAFITVGHLRHHLNILRDRYGVATGQ